MKLRNQSCQLILGHYNFLIGEKKLSPKIIFPIIGDNFSDLLSKFFHSPKRDFP